MHAQENKKTPETNSETLNRSAEYPGGMEAFMRYISNKMLFAEKSFKIRISFSVEHDGTLSNVKVYNGLGEEFNCIITEIITNCKAWVPALQNGKPIKNSFTIPVTYTHVE